MFWTKGKNIFNKLWLFLFPLAGNDYQPQSIKGRFFIYSFLVLLVLRGVFFPFLYYLPQSSFFADLTKASLLRLTNEERADNGLSVLELSPKLELAAQQKAQDILLKDYFAHQSPDGLTPWHWFEKAGYDYKYAGENLAIGFLDSEEVNQAWLKSPSHRANLLNENYKEIGLAIVSGDFQGKNTSLVVQMFGSPEVLTRKTVETVETVETVKIVETVEDPKKQVIEEDYSAEQDQLTSEQIKSEQEAELSSILGIAKQEEPELVEELVQGGLVDQSSSEVGQLNSSELAKLARLFSENYESIIKLTIFSSIIFFSLILILSIVVNIKVQFPRLIGKTLILIIFMGLLFFLDKLVLLKLIPHNLFIA